MRFVVRLILLGAALAVAAGLIMSETRVGQLGGVGLLLLFLLASYASDWLAAWTNERHIEQRPDLLRNDAIGKTVVAFGSFRITGDIPTGFVTLNGETWKACCSHPHMPEDNEVLTVRRREGLTLYVEPRGTVRTQAL